MTKWGLNVAISRIRLYGRPYGGPVVKWGQTEAISTISLYRGPFGGPVLKWGQNVNLNKVGAEIALFLSQPI